MLARHVTHSCLVGSPHHGPSYCWLATSCLPCLVMPLSCPNITRLLICSGITILSGCRTHIFAFMLPGCSIDELLYESCQGPSHGGSYVDEGTFHIRIGLPPRIVSGDYLASPSHSMLPLLFAHAHVRCPMSVILGLY